MRKSITRITGLFLAFLIAFTSVNVPAMAVSADAGYFIESSTDDDAITDTIVADETDADETSVNEATVEAEIDLTGSNVDINVKEETISEDDIDENVSSDKEAKAAETWEEEFVEEENLSEANLAASETKIIIDAAGETVHNVESVYSDYYAINDFEYANKTLKSVYPVYVIFTDIDLRESSIEYVRINGTIYENIPHKMFPSLLSKEVGNGYYTSLDKETIRNYISFIPTEYIQDTDKAVTIEYIIPRTRDENGADIKTCDVLSCSVNFHSETTNIYEFDKPIYNVSPSYANLGVLFTPNLDTKITKIELGQDGRYFVQESQCDVFRGPSSYDRAYPAFYKQIGEDKYANICLEELGNDVGWSVRTNIDYINSGIYDLRVTLSNGEHYVYKNAVNVRELDKVADGSILAQPKYYINDLKTGANDQFCDGMANLNFLFKEEVYENSSFHLILDGEEQYVSQQYVGLETDGYRHVCFKGAIDEGTHSYKIIVELFSGKVEVYEGTFEAERVKLTPRKNSLQYLAMDSKGFWFSGPGCVLDKKKNEKVSSVRFVHKSSDYKSKTVKIPECYVDAPSAYRYEEGSNCEFENNGEIIHANFLDCFFPWYLSSYVSFKFPLDITPASLDAPEGLYDVEITTTLNNTFVVEDQYYFTKKPVAQSFNAAKTGAYVCDPDSDYIAMVVYGKNLYGEIPTFYTDEACTSKALEFVDADKNCEYSPQLEDGVVYKLKRTNPLADLTGDLYVKFDNSEIFYVGNAGNLVLDAEGNKSVAIKGKVDDSKNVVYPFFGNGKTKLFKIYMGNAITEYIKENDVRFASVKVKQYKYGNDFYEITTSGVFPFAYDEQGRYLIDIPSSSPVFTNMTSNGTIVVNIEGIGDIVSNAGGYSTSELKDILEHEYDVYFIDATDMSNIMDFYLPADVGGLYQEQYDILATLPAVVMEYYDQEGNFISNSIVKFASPDYDTFTFIDDGMYLDKDGKVLDETPNITKFPAEGLIADFGEYPIREGYVFDGWYFDSKFTKPVKNGGVYTCVGGKNVNIYAKWIPREYTVRIKGFSDENIYEFKVKYDEKFKLDINDIDELKRAGYEIKGVSLVPADIDTVGKHPVDLSFDKYVFRKEWFSNYFIQSLKDWDGDYYYFGEQKVIDLCIEPDGWSKLPYNIVYHAGGGTLKDGLKKDFLPSDELYTIPVDAITGVGGFEFEGWYDNSSFTGDKIKDIDFTNVSSDIHLYAKWVPENLTIKFIDSPIEVGPKMGTLKSTSTKVMSDIECYYGEYITLPANAYTAVAVDDGNTNKYAFVGWVMKDALDKIYLDKQATSFIPDKEFVQSGNILELYPVFEPMGVECTISYYTTQDDLTTPWAEETYRTGTAKKISKIPTKDGYVFTGWMWDGNVIKTITAKDRGDKKLIAQWKPKTYQFAFNPNGGKGKATVIKLSYEDILELSEYKDLFEKNGYELSGWDINGSVCGSTDTITISETIGNIANNAKITLKAQWSPKMYNYNLQDRFGDTITGEYTYSDKAQAIPTPSGIDGVKFIGWSYDEAGKKYAAKYNSKTNITNLNAKVTDNLNLHSVYEIPYVVRMHGAEIGQSKVISGYKEGVKRALPANPFNNIGNSSTTFKGWGLKHNDDVVFYCVNKALIDANGLLEAGDMRYEAGLKSMVVDLYPIWEDTPFGDVYYAQFYDGYGHLAKGNMSDQTFKFGEMKAIAKNKFTRTDAVFAFWTDQYGNEYADGEKIAGVTSKNDGVVVDVKYPRDGHYGSVLMLTAHWTDTFVLNFEANCGASVIDMSGIKNFTYKYGTVMNAKTFATLPAPTRNGYDFAGWYTDATCKKAFKEITAKTSGNYTLYAKWNPKKYTISYDAGVYKTGVVVKGKMKDSSFVFGKESALPKSGYTVAGMKHIGWINEKDGRVYEVGQKITGYINPSENITYPEGGKMKLIALWEPVEYKVKFVDKTTNRTYEDYEYTYHSYDGRLSLYNPLPENKPLPEPVAIGYSFDGWYKDAKFKNKVESFGHGETGNVTLYAKWRVVS